MTVDAHNADTQAALSTEDALQLLLEGNTRFVNAEPLKREWGTQVKQTSEGQWPFASVVSCIDSRIPTEVVFDQGIGDIFNARVAGNFVNDDILGSLEFACKLAGSKLILILGHTSCGAVKGACDKAELGLLTQLLEKINPAVDAVTTKPGEQRTSANLDFVNRVSAENVVRTIADLRERSAVLRQMESDGEIIVRGAMYDVASGQVTLLD